MADNFDLDRFVRAQDDVLHAVRQELASGRKKTHWMWFIFPQLAGLGHSDMAQRYAIGSPAEAAAYIRHGALGTRLVECTESVLRVEGRSAADVFGAPDNMKFHSSMTLFSSVPGAPLIFERALATYFAGAPDNATLKLLSSAQGSGLQSLIPSVGRGLSESS